MRNPLRYVKPYTPRCQACRNTSIPCQSHRLQGKFLRHTLLRHRGGWVKPVEIYQTPKGAYRVVLTMRPEFAASSRDLQRALFALAKKSGHLRAELGE